MDRARRRDRGTTKWWMRCQLSFRGITREDLLTSLHLIRHSLKLVPPISPAGSVHSGSKSPPDSFLYPRAASLPSGEGFFHRASVPLIIFIDQRREERLYAKRLHCARGAVTSLKRVTEGLFRFVTSNLVRYPTTLSSCFRGLLPLHREGFSKPVLLCP